MTKKDYELIAEVIKHIGTRRMELRTLAFIANRFSQRLTYENYKFDEDKFKKACGLSGF
jgi:hypothetical protein